MEPLELSLMRAARTADWQREVIHRCAWCRRVATADGTYVEMPAIEADTVVTDGMCPRCGSRALTEITRRTARKAA